MGGFHVALNFLAVFGKKYQNSSLEDLLIESGAPNVASISSLVECHHPAGRQVNCRREMSHGQNEIVSSCTKKKGGCPTASRHNI